MENRAYNTLAAKKILLDTRSLFGEFGHTNKGMARDSEDIALYFDTISLDWKRDYHISLGKGIVDLTRVPVKYSLQGALIQSTYDLKNFNFLVPDTSYRLALHCVKNALDLRSYESRKGLYLDVKEKDLFFVLDKAIEIFRNDELAYYYFFN